MKPGFTLIEVLLVLVLGSIIITTLYTSFFQIYRSVMVVDAIVDVDTRFHILANQLEKDLSTVFIPEQAYELKATGTQPANGQKKPADAPKEQTPKTKEKEKKPLADVFVSTNKDKTLHQLAFVSTNPLQPYLHAKNTQVSPRVVRIAYDMELDSHTKQYRLNRTQSSDLDLKTYKSDKKKYETYELITGIQSVAFEYLYLPKQDKQEKDAALTFEKVAEWKVDPKDTKKPKFPHFIIMRLTLLDGQEKEHEYTRWFEVMASPEMTKTTQVVTTTSAQPQPVQPPTKPVPIPGNTAVPVKKLTLPTIDEVKKSVQELISMLGNQS